MTLRVHTGCLEPGEMVVYRRTGAAITGWRLCRIVIDTAGPAGAVEAGSQLKERWLKTKKEIAAEQG